MLIFTFAVLTALTLTEGRSAGYKARYERAMSSHVEEVSRIRERSHGKPDPKAGIALDKWVENRNEKPWEVGSYFGGDMLTQEQPGLTGPRNGLKGEKFKWKNGTIPYVIAAIFDANETKLFNRAFRNFEKETCLNFVKWTDEANYIVLNASKAGCFSAVGKNVAPGPQVVNLQRPKCSRSFETIVHELMHAIGFDHEANQYGRDEWVDINWDNINKTKRHNFEIEKRDNHTTFGVEYNYNSVMHYGGFFFAANASKPTMIAKKPKPLKFMGARSGKGLTDSDARKIRMMYDCPPRNITTTTPKPKKPKTTKLPVVPAKKKPNKNKPKYEWVDPLQ